MGHKVNAQCRQCGHSFTVVHGGGFFFHLTRCDRCGKTKSVSFERLGELHLRFLKGSPGPYCVASTEHDKYVREQAAVEPISEAEYHKGIEAIAGKCRCRGSYKLDSPPRCPKCRSAEIDEGQITVYYD